jgi:membrane fusion protein (multidrug efflux system)
MTAQSKILRVRLVGGAAAVTAVVLVSGAWLHSRHFETTDDATIDGHVHYVSARTTGTVIRVNPDVENNRVIAAGTLLVELDPNDDATVLEQAKAVLAQKEAEARSADARVPIVKASAFGQLAGATADAAGAEDAVATEQANLSAATHRVAQDAATADRADRDRARFLALVEKHEVSRSEFDAKDAEATAAAEQLAGDRAAVTAIERRVAQAKNRVTREQADVAASGTAPEQLADARARAGSAAAEVLKARADVHAAELRLSYTRIYAPVGGVVGGKTVEVGHRIQPGQALLAIVPNDDVWVTANFKETQLAAMRPGQSVRVHVDAFDFDVWGSVDELPGAAATLFSLLPSENASGNFVKVVQRLPVRIRLDAGQDRARRLRPGMSVEARVRISN